MSGVNDTARALQRLAVATPLEIKEALKAISATREFEGFYQPLYFLRSSLEDAGKLIALDISKAELFLVTQARLNPDKQHQLLMDALRDYADSVHVQYLTGTYGNMPSEDLTESCYEDVIESFAGKLSLDTYMKARSDFYTLFQQRNK